MSHGFVDLSASPSYHVLEQDDEPTDEHLLVDAVYTASKDHWTVNVPFDDPAKVVSYLQHSASSLCEALHGVANEIERRNLYGADRYDPNATEHGKRLKKCRYCHSTIFFAETINGKWMPVDSESVPASLTGSTYAYQVRTVNGGLRAPQVTPAGKHHQGQVWIAHQNVCGATPKPPDSPYLLARWEKNRGVTLQQTKDAVQELTDAALMLREN